MTNDREYTDFEQLTALHQFQETVTQECVEIIADELNHGESLTMKDLFQYINIFANAPDNLENEYFHFLLGGVRRRDPDFIRMVASQLHKPHCLEETPEWIAKLDEIKRGAKPAFRVV